jgi:hypothetical protein
LTLAGFSLKSPSRVTESSAPRGRSGTASKIGSTPVEKAKDPLKVNRLPWPEAAAIFSHKNLNFLKTRRQRKFRQITGVKKSLNFLLMFTNSTRFFDYIHGFLFSF